MAWIIGLCGIGLMIALGWHDSGHMVVERIHDDQDDDQPLFWWR